jgi:hypothetical protein
MEIEKMAEPNKLFFYVADLLQMRVLFTSHKSKEMIGVDPKIVTPYHFFELTHPDDQYRLSLGRSKVMKMAHDLFKAEGGCSILSTNLHMLNPNGFYSNFLLQLYVFAASIPYKSVYVIKTHVIIDRFKMPKNWFHYYVGNDESVFRLPDAELLQIGMPFSVREFEIIRMIESGLTSEQIAEKIFLSVHTVNTHRRNILAKSEKETMSELIYELLEKGVL